MAEEEKLPVPDRIQELTGNSKPLTSKYLPLESATRFAFDGLIGKLKKEVREKNKGISREDYDRIMYKNLKKFKLNGQEFEFINVKNNFGGKRWYVLCPKCNKPKLTLFFPSKFPHLEQKYLCGDCHNLRCISFMMGKSTRYVNVIKPLKKLERLKKKIMAPGINAVKAKPLLEEYEKIEKDLLASPQYRLWKFQMEHGQTKYPV